MKKRSPKCYFTNLSKEWKGKERKKKVLTKGLVNKYRGGGGGGPEHFEMWWLENT